MRNIFCGWPLLCLWFGYAALGELTGVLCESKSCTLTVIPHLVSGVFCGQMINIYNSRGTSYSLQREHTVQNIVSIHCAELK